jgi:hypothetical protein
MAAIHIARKSGSRSGAHAETSSSILGGMGAGVFTISAI